MGRFERCARQSARLRLIPVFVSAGLIASFAGCGGGPSASIQPPPPAPDFLLGVIPSTITVAQGSTSGSVAVSVTPQNGFSGTVQVSFSNLPAGLTANPTSPFSVSPGASVSVLFSATNSAATGSVNITATGTSGALTHTAPLGLTVQASVAANLPRSNYVRTDAVAAFDNPPGESHHVHMVLDVARHHLFVANRANNRLEVISTADGSRVSEIAAPGATSADISSDGNTVWVGSLTQAIYEIDTDSLQIRGTHVLDGLSPLPNTIFDRPEEVVAMAGGKSFVRLRQPATAEALLALWDPGSNTLTNLTPAAPQVFQAGLGALAKASNGSRTIVAAADSSGEIALFDGNGAVVAGPVTVGGGAISNAAANGAGSRFAVLFSGSSGRQVLLLDGLLNLIGSYSGTNPASILFSQDGASLAVSEQFGTGSALTLLDANDLHVVGRVSDVAVAGIPTQLEAVDSSKLFFGLANRGVSFVDAAKPASLSQPAPAFSVNSVAQPATGPNSGGTSTVLAGANFEATASVQFGAQSATVQGSAASQLQVTSPASAASGAANLTAFFPDGWTTLAPDAFSYGPQILKILPNAGNKSGNETIAMYGYGFGSDATKLTVKIGGTSATVQKIDSVSALASSLGLDATYPFPLQRVIITATPGTAGTADVAVASPSGSTNSVSGYLYFQSEQIFPKAGFYKFLLYDQSRNRVYLSATDHVDVFDLASSSYLAAIQPPGGPPPNAGLRGLALTPDSSQMIVADFGAQSIYVINPDTSAGSASFVGGISGYQNSGPSRVAPTSAKTVFVGMSAEGGTQSGCSACLAQMDVSAFPPTIAPATQPEISFLTGSPLLLSDSSGDHVFFSFATAPGGPIAEWSASSPGQFQTSIADASTIDLAVAQDGNAFAVRENSLTSLRASNLNVFGTNTTNEIESIPGRTEVPGATLHPTGALLYVPFLTGAPPALPPAKNITGGIDIRDARTGALRRRMFLPEPFAMLSTDVDAQHGSFLAIDENGQRLFALTTSGLTVIQLATVPLGIGSVNPPSGPAAGGTNVTLRGSGFQSATALTIGGKSVPVTFKDTNTLLFATPALAAGSQRIFVTNPNGETVSLDAAFTAN